MFLDEGEIRGLIRNGELSWDGELRRDSLLLRLGSPLQCAVPTTDGIVDLSRQDQIDTMYEDPVMDWATFQLPPRGFVLCHVSRALALGPGVGGLIGGLSHLARVGLTVHLDTPIVDAGFTGRLTMEMFNAGPRTLRIHRGMPVAKVLLYRIGLGPRSRPAPHAYYGAETRLGSRYADEFYPARARDDRGGGQDNE